MFKNNSKVTARKLLTQIKEQKKVAEYRVTGIDKGIKNAQISPVATEGTNSCKNTKCFK